MLHKLITLSYLSIFLISVGLYMLLSTKKAMSIIIGLEIITNGVALNLILMSYGDNLYTGGIISLFLIILSTINAVFIIIIFIVLFKANKSADLQNIGKLKIK